MEEQKNNRINLRVALQLGYGIYEIQFDKRGLHWDGHIYQVQFQKPKIQPHGVEWFKQLTLEEWDAIAPTAKGLWGGAPDYCTEPDAADALRLEIESRGLRWSISANGRSWDATVVKPGGMIATQFYENSDYSPYRALCLAFLAACEAENTPK